MTDAALELIADEPEFALARLGGVQLQVWRTATPLRGAAMAEANAVDFRGESPVGLFIVVLNGCRPPDPPARSILTRIGTRLEHGRACAFVHEGEGFMAATMRSVMAGMVLVARPAFPVRVFSAVGEGARWFAEQAAFPSPSGLVIATQELRVHGTVGA